MTSALKFTALTGLLVGAALAAQADQTNSVQNLNLRLFGLEQGPVKTNRYVVSTKLEVVPLRTHDVIMVLGAATSNSFSRKATLAIVTPLPDGPAGFQVRDGTNHVDVSAFFTYQVAPGSLTEGELNLKTKRSSSSELTVQRLALHDAAGGPVLALHFDVSGIVVESSSNGPDCDRDRDFDDAGSVAGPGDLGGKLLIIQGSFTPGAETIEVVPTSGGGGGGGPGV